MCLCTQGTRLVLLVPGHTVRTTGLGLGRAADAAGHQRLEATNTCLTQSPIPHRWAGDSLRGLQWHSHSGERGRWHARRSPRHGLGEPGSEAAVRGQWLDEPREPHELQGPRRAIRSCSGTAERGGSGTCTRAQDKSAQGQGLDPQERRKCPQSWSPAASCGTPGNGSVLHPPSGEAFPRRVPPSLRSLWPPASHSSFSCSAEALSHLRRQPITSVYGGNGKLDGWRNSFKDFSVTRV